MKEELADICVCDVGDKQKLAVFREKRSEWRDALIGRDGHSVANQITAILWEDAIFQTVNEARRLFVEAPATAKGFNPDLLQLLDKGFVVSQIMAIRRLTDPGFSDADRALVSLTSLINDMERNHGLLTREHYICYDGSPFEYPPDDSMECFHWGLRQHHFDRLSGTDEKHRGRTDKVDHALFPRLRQNLRACEDFRVYANKFIAHAAAPSDKRDKVKEERLITLDKFADAYRAIVQVASFLSVAIVYAHQLGRVPTPQYDHLENLDKPMILESEFGALSKFWHGRVQEVEKWGSIVWPDDALQRRGFAPPLIANA